MSYLESPASKNEEDSLISKELKKGVANYSDRLKDAFESGDVSKFEKLENKLKKKKKVLKSRTGQRESIVVAMMSSSLWLMASTYNISHNPNDYFPNLTGFWSNIFYVDYVLLIVFLGFTIAEEIIYQITNWRKRRNTTQYISDNEGDETNETEIDNLTNRFQKLVEDLNENYEPMKNRYKRRFNQYAIYSFVVYFVLLTIFIPFSIDILYHHTKRSSQRTLSGFFLFFFVIALPISFYYELSKYKKHQF
ncbi:unnamed protein product [Caenorhabditis nigoni]